MNENQKRTEQLRRLKENIELLRTKLDKLEASIDEPLFRITESEDIDEVNACNFESTLPEEHDDMYAIFMFPDGMYRGRCRKHFSDAIDANISIYPYIKIFKYPLVYLRKNEYSKKEPDIVQTYSTWCGLPDCESGASMDAVVRNTELVKKIGQFDEILFTCANGHRNKLLI